MLRKAGPQDAAALEAFLARHAAHSMFLRGNLAAHGTQELHHRHGSVFLLKEEKGDMIAVAGCTNGGFLMCQAPQQGAAFWKEVCAALQGRSVEGITGDPMQTAAWADALGLQAQDYSINEIEPLFEMDLSEVAPVDPALSLRRPKAAEAAMLTDWYAGFHQETGLTLSQGTTNNSIAKGFVRDPDGRVLMADGVPVAMTKLNARAMDTVQIGGVYVPPEQRGHGFGGDVVALHLAELAQQGVKTAVLFAANDHAARAYVRIGFRQVGEYRIAMLKTPMLVVEASVGLSLGEG